MEFCTYYRDGLRQRQTYQTFPSSVNEKKQINSESSFNLNFNKVETGFDVFEELFFELLKLI